ncbi:MAG: GGDEF domain-containing protein [Candidatus Limnocylindrales bacterium]|nr:GGDEF domain-containing protein [Candidatus Limnocylindrales bacterium]
MPVTPVLILIVAAVAVNLVLMAFIVIPPMLGRPSRLAPGTKATDAADRTAAEAAVVGGLVATAGEDGLANPTYDRIVRIVAWVFLLTTTAIVAATGLWAETQPAILVLLAFGGLFVVVVHDLLPADILGPAKFVVEGSVAITVATLLVALTGGVASPFFFVFPLIVGGAALVVSSTITVALAGGATLGYVLAIFAGSPAGALGPVTAATVGVNLTALILLAYAAMVIAREQRRTRDAAIRLSTVDPLTGLFNRTFFFAAVGREIARCARSGRGFCLLMMDLDDLKAINDRLGHFQGDRVLRGVGEVIADGVRRIDTAARYGGDEFVVLLPETDPTGAFVLAEKIRLGVNAMAIDLPDAAHPSVSVGVVSYPGDGRTADELMISADNAMYASKRAGKDRVTGVSIPIHQGGRHAGHDAGSEGAGVDDSGVASPS